MRVAKGAAVTAGEHISRTVTEIDLIEVDETVDHDERERRRARSYTVEVRTLAGFEALFRVHPDELVEKLAQHAEQYFVNRGELGRAQRTIFVTHRYLRDRELQREINSGLNVVESWNYGNSVIFFGKGGDIPGNRRDQQELSVLCLRVLQASTGYLNTLMIQDVLADGAVVLTTEDERGLNPLFWSNIAPYGEVKLDLGRRITLAANSCPAVALADGCDPCLTDRPVCEGEPRRCRRRSP